MAIASAEPNAARANLVFRSLRRLGRLLFRALFVIEAGGLDQVPAEGPYVLACNHISWIDPLILMSILPPEPRVHYLAAAEFTTEGPGIVRAIVKTVGGIIAVDRQGGRRDRQAVVQALRVLRGGGAVGIFPEGRCGEQEGQIQPLKDGAALFAVKMGCPVVVAGISGTLALCLRRRIRVRFGPAIMPGAAESAAELLERIAHAMAETVPPVHPDQPARPRMAWLAKMF
jgi:1-acyl-sn-glycerol-3-phosphate acyltransferase